MQVGNSRHDRATEAFGASRRRPVLDRVDPAIGADGEHDIVGPTIRQQGSFSEKQLMVICYHLVRETSRLYIQAL